MEEENKLNNQHNIHFEQKNTKYQNQNISPIKKENEKHYRHDNNIHEKNFLNHHLYSSHNDLPNNDVDPFRQNESK